MIETTLIIAFLKTKNQKVPDKYVLFLRIRNKIIKLVSFLQNPELLLQSENTGAASHIFFTFIDK